MQIVINKYIEASGALSTFLQQTKIQVQACYIADTHSDLTAQCEDHTDLYSDLLSSDQVFTHLKGTSLFTFVDYDNSYLSGFTAISTVVLRCFTTLSHLSVLYPGRTPTQPLVMLFLTCSKAIVNFDPCSHCEQRLSSTTWTSSHTFRLLLKYQSWNHRHQVNLVKMHSK